MQLATIKRIIELEVEHANTQEELCKLLIELSKRFSKEEKRNSVIPAKAKESNKNVSLTCPGE